MRLFNIEVFNDWIEGESTVYTSPELNEVLALGKTLTIQAIANLPGGAENCTLSVDVEVSADGQRWVDRVVGDQPIDRVSMSTTSTNSTSGSDASGKPFMPFTRLKIKTESGWTKGHVKVLVCARGKGRRFAALTTPRGSSSRSSGSGKPCCDGCAEGKGCSGSSGAPGLGGMASGGLTPTTAALAGATPLAGLISDSGGGSSGLNSDSVPSQFEICSLQHGKCVSGCGNDASCNACCTYKQAACLASVGYPGSGLAAALVNCVKGQANHDGLSPTFDPPDPPPTTLVQFEPHLDKPQGIEPPSTEDFLDAACEQKAEDCHQVQAQKGCPFSSCCGDARIACRAGVDSGAVKSAQDIAPFFSGCWDCQAPENVEQAQCKGKRSRCDLLCAATFFGSGLAVEKAACQKCCANSLCGDLETCAIDACEDANQLQEQNVWGPLRQHCQSQWGSNPTLLQFCLAEVNKQQAHSFAACLPTGFDAWKWSDLENNVLTY